MLIGPYKPMELIHGRIQVIGLKEKSRENIIQHTCITSFPSLICLEYPIILAIISFLRAGYTTHTSCVFSIALTHF